MSDLIRREDAFKAVLGVTTYDTVDDVEIHCDASVAGSEGWLGGVRDSLRAIEDVPSAEPERTAKVIFLEMKRNPKNIVWKCAECGQYMHRASWTREVNYCSHCGAKLDWGEDDE